LALSVAVVSTYSLAQTTSTPGLRAMELRDVPAATALLKEYLANRALHPIFSEEEVAHWFLPRHDIILSYVVEVFFLFLR
jgi:glycylpeptide N-tetradecanoyltransferase